MNTEKLELQKQWNTTPCGTGKHVESMEQGSLQFFDEIRRSRYEVTDPWMKLNIDFDAWNGKKVLEIGHGLGTDLLSFCEGGAEVYGIDITETHHRLAKRNFETHNRVCTLKLCDSANIDFPAEFFDCVYSNGVLHHTPDTIRCVSEAYRVLKPGGTFILSMYNRYSAFHLYTKLFFDGLLRGKLRQLGYKGLMATVENGADGISIKPLVKTYSKRQLRWMLSDFSKVELRVVHLRAEHLPVVGKFLTRFIERALEPRLGWYLLAFATK